VITALVSKKGGVGKTTTAVNLAAALAERGRRVLLVDLDSQASASLSLGIPRARLAPSSADVLLHGVPLLETVRPTADPNLDLVTGSVDLVHAEVDLGGYHQPAVRLQRALEPVAPRYDHVFLDCPPSVSLLPTNALVASDAFVVPVIPQFLAVAGVESLLRYAERLRWREDVHTRLLGLVLTLADYRNKTTHEHVGFIREEYGNDVFGVEIRINTRLAEAPEQGQSILRYDPRATGARAYRLLADEFELKAARWETRPSESLAVAATP
jgi:chromosome partitioning protein